MFAARLSFSSLFAVEDFHFVSMAALPYIGLFCNRVLYRKFSSDLLVRSFSLKHLISKHMIHTVQVFSIVPLFLFASFIVSKYLFAKYLY